MFIYIVSASKMNPTKLQNTVAKAIYKHLDGAFELKKYSNLCEIKSTILYQIPKEIADKFNLPKDVRDKVNEIDVRVSVTTYADKIRVEVIELSPKEQTLAFKTFKTSTFDNVQKGLDVVMGFVKKSINKAFDGYDILF